ncbi:LuxR family transcriptional regulator [Streptomyces hoynatensis]|uniref:LuxR family transcriptional regulator n=2 Tax=Streptomyces hoynatensis TaxID=1141874 RepID=A0A3A9YYU8_9ACTN|nr:LuxR family transcriptional regulator [Streptomyces hoynatensis]
MVGRAREVEHIRARLAAALGPTDPADPLRERLLLLNGRPGSGKTTVLNAVLAQPPGEAAVLRAAGLAADRALPYGLASRLLGEPPPAGRVPAGPAEQELLHSLHLLVSPRAARGPLLLAVDDLHLADGQSLRWLGYLLRRSAELPLAVLATAPAPTPDHVLEALADLLPAVADGRLRLLPLGAPAVAELIEARCRRAPDLAFATACRRLSGGNPALLTRLLDAVVRAGLPPDRRAVARLESIAAGLLREVIPTWLDAQPPVVRDVARHLAVLGSPSAHLLAALGRVPAREVPGALGALRDNGVLAADGESFAHPLVREAVLGAVPPAELAATRLRAARLLNDAGRRPRVVADQILLAGGAGHAWAARVLVEAAREAVAGDAFEAAARYLEPLVERAPEDAGLRRQLAGVLAQRRPAEALAEYREALRHEGHPRRRAALAVEVAATAVAARRSASVLADLERELDALGRAGEPLSGPERERRACVEGAVLLAGLQESATCARTRERAAAMHPPAGETPDERLLLAMLAVEGTMRGDAPGRMAALARQALPLDDVDVHGRTVLAASFVLTAADEPGAALGPLGRVVAHCARRGLVATHCQALSARAAARHAAGDLVEAVAEAELALEIARQESWRDGEVRPAIVLGAALALGGAAERAERVLASIDARAVAGLAREYPAYLMARALTKVQTGDLVEALRLLRRCGAGLAESGLTNPLVEPWWAEAALLLAAQGRVREAMPLVEWGEQLVERWDVPRARGLLLTAQAATRSGQAAVETWERAAEALEKSSDDLGRLRAEYHLGRALLQAGHTRQARHRLRTAADLATRCGARPAAEAARTLLLRAGGRMRPGSGSKADVLTDRERRVVSLALDGRTNREIAQRLTVTPRTVEVHLTNAYRKLGISGRAELAEALAHEIV